MILGVGVGIPFMHQKPVFNPRSINGLKIWLDATKITGLTDGTLITQWDDLSGNNFHATQSTDTKKPKYRKNIKGGLSVVNFDGLDDFLFLSGSALSLLQNIDYAAIFIVSQTTTPGSSRYLFSASIDSLIVNARLLVTRERTAANKLGLAGRRMDGDTLVVVEGDSFVAAEWFLQTTIFDFANAKAYGYKNKNLIVTADPYQTVGNTSDTASLAIAVGASPSGAASISGDIGEILVYTSLLTIEQKSQIDNYLIRKWGL